ncbi:MAG: hypothetical protein LUD68_10745 [Rikenellaceae bacterium]|nr:hypothetical protein [Rikenellaceae bacterium]
MYFEGAELVLECQTLYGDFLKTEKFTESSSLLKWYGDHEGGLHKMYVAEITNAWINE